MAQRKRTPARDEVDALYGLALEDFTAERNALARSLRERGDRTAAQEVGKLPKPTRVAWIVNQLSRARPRELAAYLKAGDELVRAHEGPLQKRGAGGELRKAAQVERAAIVPLLEAARGLATKQGRFPTETAIEGVRETLQGALVDDASRSLLERGVLTVEIPAPGLGFAAALGKRTVPRSTSRAATRAQDARRDKELREAQRAEKQARALHEEAKRTVATTIRERDRSIKAVAEAEKALERREREHIRAKGRLEDARGLSPR